MKKRNKRKSLWVILLIPVLSLLIGVIGEFLYNLPIDKQKDYEYIPIDDIKMNDFNLINGSEFQSDGGEASLEIVFDKKYIDKFRFHFVYSEAFPLECDIVVHEYQDGENLSEQVIRDVNNHILNNSVINIRAVSDRITIKMAKDSLPVTISLIAIDNTGNYSMVRFLFVSLAAFFILCGIVIIKKKIPVRIEAVFLVISLSVGSFMICAMPSHKVGYDEEIHFGRAYYFAETISGKQTIEYPFGVNELITTSLKNWPYHLWASEEEMKEENQFWNYQGDYRSEREDVLKIEDRNYSFNLYTFAYVFQWLMIKLGMLMHLPFVVIFKMGRMGNLLLYVAVVYLAIRHISQGKRILFILALMPTAMIAATTYSYDAWVNGFGFLGMAYMIEEWLDDARKISCRNYFISMGALMLSGLPKAIYCPFLLLLLLFPTSRFKNRKENLILKVAVTGAFILMAGTFMMPALSNPAQMGGDERGGNTSVAGQLQYVFSHPLFYTRLLLNSIKNTLLSYTVGVEGLGQMGHFTRTAPAILTASGVLYAVLTDSRGEQKNKIQVWQRVALVVISFGVICLIWTALYLSYTPVGLNQINGVQGRYYIPVTVWLLWAFRPDRIRNYLKQSSDHVILAAISLLILLPLLYQNMVINTF